MAKPAGELVWYHTAVSKELDAGIEVRLRLAAEYLKNKVVENISIPTREAGPSKPGQFPHADTGRLKQSIHVGDVDRLAFFVGTNVEYGVEHETGERPFLRPTMIAELKAMERIVTRAAVGRKRGMFKIE